MSTKKPMTQEQKTESLYDPETYRKVFATVALNIEVSNDNGTLMLRNFHGDCTPPQRQKVLIISPCEIPTLLQALAHAQAKYNAHCAKGRL